MGIGAGIFMIAIGAIIVFGLEVNLGWLDLDVVGWVLMLAGAAGLLLTFAFWGNRRRADTTAVVEERRVREDPRYPDPRYPTVPPTVP